MLCGCGGLCRETSGGRSQMSPGRHWLAAWKSPKLFAPLTLSATSVTCPYIRSEGGTRPHLRPTYGSEGETQPCLRPMYGSVLKISSCQSFTTCTSVSLVISLHLLLASLILYGCCGSEVAEALHVGGDVVWRAVQWGW